MVTEADGIMDRTAIVWFRNDLRIHDNEALHHAIRNAQSVIPVYVFDPRIFGGKTRFGFPKTGIFRAKFYLEAVQDLKCQLQSVGSDLVIRVGYPEDVLFNIAEEYRSSWVICNRERTSEEEKVQDILEERLWTIGQEMIYTRGKMLYYTQDLPFPITQTPDVFTHFRKEVEKLVDVRKPLPPPDCVPRIIGEFPDPGSLPSLQDLGISSAGIKKEQPFLFRGGESAGVERLQYFVWDRELIRNYKETRNGMIDWDHSSKLSPYLAAGCLSPKMIYWEIRKYESETGANESTYWMIFELLWRDFFRLMGKKYRNRMFLKGGPKNKIDPSWSNDIDLFEKWAKGMTGIPFIDANMRELNATGFMSNRGRQNVASFLVKDLNINWQLGAEYFESLLVDYDPCSNWGNWNYLAGIGSDPREDRYFNIFTQAKRYDPDGSYVKKWVPELESWSSECIHNPEKYFENELLSYARSEDSDYPSPVVDTLRWTH